MVATAVIGYSVRGAPIRAVEVGDPHSPNKALVVGCIHGDEPAGIANLALAPAHRLVRLRTPAAVGV